MGSSFLATWAKVSTDKQNEPLQMYSSSWAAVTKCHRLGGSNNGHLFLSVLETWEVKIKKGWSVGGYRLTVLT